MGENGDIRKELLMSTAPLCFVLSYYLMWETLKELTRVWFFDLPVWFPGVLGVLVLLFAIWLVYLAIFGRPRKWLKGTYQISIVIGELGIVAFGIDWLNGIADLIELNANPIFVYSFAYGGFLLIIGIFIFNIVNFIQFLSKKKTRTDVKES